jgi:hypothetical protein
MVTTHLLSLGAAALALVVAGSARAATAQTPPAAPAQTPPAQTPGAASSATPAAVPSAAGHWTGAIEMPAQPLAIEVDLKPGTGPAWIGTISIAAQNLKAFPLGSIDVQGTAVSFAMPNIPGTPTFKGTLSDDGRTIAGDITQGGGAVPFKLTRAGEAVIAPPAKSTAITKELEGDWTGTLVAGDRALRLNLKLANGPDSATGSIVSVDQGGVEIAIASIVQAGTHLDLEVPAVAGKFSGDLKDGKLVGTWSQGPGSLPLEFSRPVP